MSESQTLDTLNWIEATINLPRFHYQAGITPPAWVRSVAQEFVGLYRAGPSPVEQLADRGRRVLKGYLESHPDLIHQEADAFCKDAADLFRSQE